MDRKAIAFLTEDPYCDSSGEKAVPETTAPPSREFEEAIRINLLFLVGVVCVCNLYLSDTNEFLHVIHKF